MPKPIDLELEGRMQAIEHLLSVQIATSWVNAGFTIEMVDALTKSYLQAAETGSVDGLHPVQADALAAEFHSRLGVVLARVRKNYLLAQQSS